MVPDIPPPNSAETVEIVYQEFAPAAKSSASATIGSGSPRGFCRLSLKNEADQAGNVVALQLVLRCPKVKGGSDLLEDLAPQPGYQPFMFAASDFKAGIDKTAFGRTRVIPVPSAGLSLKVVIEDARISRLKNKDSSYQYKIKAIDLRISLVR